MPLKNRIELMNEFLMSIMSYLVVLFTPYVSSIETRYDYGWFLIILISFDIIINMSIILF